MSELIPWSEFEDEYAAKFSENNGALAKEKVIIAPGCSTTKYLAPVFLTFSASPI